MSLAHTDAGAGTAVLLLHGFPFDRTMWTAQVEALTAAGFRAIAPDLPGLGESRMQPPLPLITMEAMAQDVTTLIDHLAIDDVVVCGLSMGCYVAWEMFGLIPSRVRALVFAGGRAAGADEAEKKSREEQADRIMREGMGYSIDSILQNLLAASTLANRPAVVSHVGEMILRTDPSGAAAAQRGMAVRRDYSQDLANINVPTLIVAGREDGVRTPEDAETIHDGIKGSRLEVIDDAGHLMNMERPEVFNRVVLDFLMVSEARA